jgi:hypothetical protein
VILPLLAPGAIVRVAQDLVRLLPSMCQLDASSEIITMAEKSPATKSPKWVRGPLADQMSGSRSTLGSSNIVTIMDRLKFSAEEQPMPQQPFAVAPIYVAAPGDQGGDNTTSLCVSPSCITDTSASDYCRTPVSLDWTMPRWKTLEEKRLALCHQRVSLERRLFESSRQDVSPQKFPEPCRFLVNEEPVLWSGSVDAATQLPTGYGRLVFKDGQVYQGHCKAGLRHGQGRNVWSNQQVYTGEWSEGRREGHGTHTWPDGRTVTGAWAAGHLHGRIFFAWPDGATYDGDTVAGQKQGRGTHTWNDGRVYAGQYWAGYEHGLGMLTEVDQKSKYRGEFRQGARHGYGVQIWATKTYDGEWSNNMVHGRGKLVWRETGACYTGQFRRGRYHGIGCYTDGAKKYVGHWCDGAKEGEGKQYWSDGRVYQGSFCQNKRHGYGRMTYADGTVYTGNWKQGKRSGRCIEIATDDVSVPHCGIWRNNGPVYNETGTEKAAADDLSATKHPLLVTDDEDTLIYSRDRSFDDSDSSTSHDADTQSQLWEC